MFLKANLKLKKAEEEREGQNHLWENFH